MLLLAAAALAVLVVPYDPSGCGSAALALTASERKAPAGDEPVMDPETARKDAAAVAEARRAIDEHSAAVEAARRTAAAAEQLGESASEARYEAEDDLFEDDHSFDVTLAESRVDGAESSLASAKDNLEYWLEQQADAADDPYLGEDLYEGTVESARQGVSDAEAELAEARQELATARADQAEVTAEQQAEDAEAAALTARASAAAEEAQRLVGEAVTVDTRLREDLAAAEEAQARNEDRHAQAVADWTRRHLDEFSEVLAVNQAVEDCRALGIRTTATAAGLLAVAALTGAALRWRRA